MKIVVGQVVAELNDGLLHINTKVFGLPITVWASRNIETGKIMCNIFSGTTVLLGINPEGTWEDEKPKT